MNIIYTFAKIFLNMEYNTSQKRLIMPEYGRHVHQMVQRAVQIQDREQRNHAAYTIIGVMGSLMPHLRDVPDFKHKLWNHLLFISDFQLDIDAPYPPPARNEMIDCPYMVSYPQSHVRQRHYGKILVNMIREAGKLEDCPQRDALILLLAMQMKKSYTTWNRSELNKEQIIQDIWDISDGKIKLDPEIKLFSEHTPRENVHPPQNYHQYQGHGHGHNSKRKRKFKK